jgi:hypothetical protein
LGARRPAWQSLVLDLEVDLVHPQFVKWVLRFRGRPLEVPDGGRPGRSFSNLLFGPPSQNLPCVLFLYRPR